MSQSLQIFIEKSLEEEILIKFLNQCISGGVESIDIPINEAQYFAQLQEYPEGFNTGLNISWSQEHQLNIDEADLVKKIADQFVTRVLWQIGETEERWRLIDSKGKSYLVQVIELNEGVTINHDNFNLI